MGHVVNPISFRLGYSKYWNSCWSVSSLKGSYSYMVNQDIFLESIFWNLFHRKYGFLSNILKNVVPAGFQIIRSYNKVYLFCDFYYVQSRYIKYWLFNYFNKFFSEESLRSTAEKLYFSITKSDILLYRKFKLIFLQWIWSCIVKPLSNKFWLSLKNALTLIYFKLFNKSNIVTVYVRPITEDTISAEFLARFIVLRLEQGMPIRKILNSVNKILTQLVNRKILLGFDLKLSGRFSRVQQASCSVSRGGVLNRNIMTSNIDYAFKTANLKFSLCGVKVLLARPLNTSLDINMYEKQLSLAKWFKYIPINSYRRWQRSKLLHILSTNKTSKVKFVQLNSFI